MVFRLRSVSNIVMPAAKTGKDSNRRMVVIKIDHTNKGVWYWVIDGGFMLIMVVIKLMEARIEEIPAKCREKMVRSTDAPACAKLPARGG